MHGDPRDNQGSSDGAKIGSGIEDTRRQRALFFGEPLRNRLQARWKYRLLPKTQSKASYEKTRE